MKAVILAAGKGERLKNITNEIPKPMIRFRGKPLLQHNIELCKSHGITEIFINTFYLSEKITEYFGDGAGFDVDIRYSPEKELLGTAGAVKYIAEHFWDSPQTEPFFVIYGDNFSEYNLKALLDKYYEIRPMGVIGFHYREDVSHSGVAEFDSSGKILNFIEKPLPGKTDSHWVNAGVYLLNPEILKFIPNGFYDFAKDVFPAILENKLPLFGIKNRNLVFAFDTPEMYSNSIKNDGSKK